jgi:hypothetical protein
VAHAYSPSYSGGSDQEYHGSKLAKAFFFETLSWKIPLQKRGGGVAQGEGPEFKPQYYKKDAPDTQL